MTPNSKSVEPGPRLKALRDGLLRLHSVLLASERSVYERDIQRIPNQAKYLELVLNDPAFSYLRELSQFIVLIDETMESKEQPPTSADADRLVARARALLSPTQNGERFETRYLEALQRDPDVVLAHSTMLEVLRQVE